MLFHGKRFPRGENLLLRSYWLHLCFTTAAALLIGWLGVFGSVVNGSWYPGFLLCFEGFLFFPVIVIQFVFIFVGM